MNPIADYALIGDTRTAALCSARGSIDWLCFPRFDSPPLFSRLVAGDKGGTFMLTPEEPIRATRRTYISDSATLQTTWETASGAIMLTEAMVVDVTGALLPHLLLVRTLTCEGAEQRVRILFDPRYGFEARAAASRRSHGSLICSWGEVAAALKTDADLEVEPRREASFVVRPGRGVTFALGLVHRAPLVLSDPGAALAHAQRTTEWWQAWAEELRDCELFREDIMRSMITLRLLTYTPSGAPVAAPTTSLPERIGGDANWDYRYSWPRDAGIGLAVFLALERPEEAHSFMHWLLHASRLSRPRLDVLYTLYGETPPRERMLQGLPGYRNSVPVRVGNAAKDQHQLDVYGWVVDTSSVLANAGQGLHREMWRVVSGLADFVADHWRDPDAGIWELRGADRHYVHSKLMGWLALDRSLRMTDRFGTKKKRRERWERERAELANDIRTKGFDSRRNTYVRSYGSDDLDAALLLLPVIEFDDPASPGVAGTIAAVARELDAGDGLLYRFRSDEGEGAFLACSFWMVQALARTGRLDDAAELFDRLLGKANDVGLYAEEMDPSTGEHLGNFPQALTHAALAQACIALAQEESRVNAARGGSPATAHRPRGR